jgi:hypothetical protein
LAHSGNFHSEDALGVPGTEAQGVQRPGEPTG